MTFPTITLDISALGIAAVTLNRPERGNALNQALIDDTAAAFTALAANPAARVIVLRGAGKHFCAGADLGGPAPGAGPAQFSLPGMMEAIDRCPKPVIAAVQGAAIGGGFALTACCDIILASPDAFFSIPEARLGITPSPVLRALFLRAVGYRQFRRYGLSGERISAEQALAFGHVSEICGEGGFEPRIAAIADALLHSAPGAAAALKAAIAEYGTPPAEVLYDPRERDAKHGRSAEMEEGVAAFREKRKPKWYPG